MFMDKHAIDQLVRDVAAGDAAAYRRLLEVSAGLLRGYLAGKMTGPLRADLEDIVQETLLAVHLKYHSYNASLPFLPWLRTIAQHKLIDYWRRRKITGAVPLDDDLADTMAVSTPSSSGQTDASLTLERLMHTLNDKQQRVVRLARIDGKSMVEIANDLNISVADVKVTLHRALRKLGDKAKEDNINAYG